MRIIRAATELGKPCGKVCLAIGFFDGVHLGHQHIIRHTIEDSRQHEGVALVVTFDQHPNVVVAPSRVPPLIYPLKRKQRAIESLAADALLLLHFDRDFSRQSGEEFIRRLVEDLGPVHSLCVGANFVFGHKRSGDVTLLRKLGAEMGFAVHGMSAVSLDGHAVSSTRIREMIAKGDLDAAGQMLGRAYSLSGPVIRGDGVGRQLGFPTANMDVTGLAVPPTGVYAVHAASGGKIWRAVLNIGYRPTLKQSNAMLHVEAHLVNSSEDLYGRELEVTFVARLRDERKFPNLEELRQQIGQDIAEALKKF